MQGTVGVYGGPGSGKSTVGALIRPRWWITKEQEPRAAGEMFRRVTPDHMPQIVAVDTVENVAEALHHAQQGPVVIDSLSAFGMKEGLMVAHMLIQWSKQRNDRGLAIMQVNSRGDTAGYMELPHLFDAIVNLSPDPWGVRAFRIEKSRWSPLEGAYWCFDTEGKVSKPTFDAAYSVEGEPGNYWLHPYPLKGSKWSGLLQLLEGAEQLSPGIASSAVRASYMSEGFIQPMDYEERQRFAHRNGLEWLSPSDVDLEDLLDCSNTEPAANDTEGVPLLTDHPDFQIDPFK
tara:strand:+ start:18323 stop:19189 length:867 start_codon:yes stop_codon:yes gene_type:complete